MTTSTFRDTKYEDLGETWRCHQSARILSRHLQFGKHCRLDLDALLVGMARTIKRELEPTTGGCAPTAVRQLPMTQLTRIPCEYLPMVQ